MTISFSWAPCTGAARRFGHFLAAAVMLGAGAAFAQPSDFMGPSVQNLSVGLFCQPNVDLEEESPGSASGFRNVISAVPVHVKSTQTIDTRLGNTFGVQVRMKNDDHWGSVELRYTHPPFPNDGTTEQNLTQDFYDDWNVFSYTFDFPYEQVEGIWTLEAWSDTEQLFRISFDMVSGTGQAGASPRCN